MIARNLADMEATHAQVHAAWALLGSAINRHPLLVLHAARWLVIRGLNLSANGRYPCRLAAQLLAYLKTPAVEESERTHKSIDRAVWTAELRQKTPFMAAASDESVCEHRCRYASRESAP